MKRFFLMILLVSVFFTGLGTMLDKTAARIKSDERALALLQKARQAIGGDNSVNAINSLLITGKSTRTFRFDGTERTEQGDMEIAMQLPDKMMRMVKMRHENGKGETFDKQIDMTIVHQGDENLKWKTADGTEPKIGGGQTVVIKKDDGTVEEVQTGSGQKVFVRKDGKPGEIQAGDDKHMVFEMKGEKGEFPWQTSDLMRTSLALFLSVPQSMEVNYLYGGESSVDSTACNVVEAQFGKSSVKLFLAKDSNLPMMISYQDAKPMVFTFRTKDGEAPPVEGDKQVRVFSRQSAPQELAEFQVKFSDYRNVNGVLLPHKWTQTIGGQTDEIVDITGYEVNPANIAEKFKSHGDHKVFIRKAKEQ